MIADAINGCLWGLSYMVLSTIDWIYNSIIDVAGFNFLQSTEIQEWYQLTAAIAVPLIIFAAVLIMLKQLARDEQTDLNKFFWDLLMVGAWMVAIPLLFQTGLEMGQMLIGALNTAESKLAVDILNASLYDGTPVTCANEITSGFTATLNDPTYYFNITDHCTSTGEPYYKYVNFFLSWCFGGASVVILMIDSVLVVMNQFILAALYIASPLVAWSILSKNQQQIKTFFNLTGYYFFASFLILFALTLGMDIYQSLKEMPNVTWLIEISAILAVLGFTLTIGSLLGRVFFGQDASMMAGFQTLVGAMTTMSGATGGIVKSGANVAKVAGVAGVVGVGGAMAGGAAYSASSGGFVKSTSAGIKGAASGVTSAATHKFNQSEISQSIQTAFHTSQGKTQVNGRPMPEFAFRSEAAQSGEPINGFGNNETTKAGR